MIIIHPGVGELKKKWDFFISHASEDKAKIVEPLAHELTNKGAKVWYDSWSLKIGDNLSAKIDDGLVNSEFGIVVLSPSFFAKPWPQRELSGLVQREIQGRKVILPVWHDVDYNYVAEKSPTLADKMAGSTSLGIPHLADTILEAASADELIFPHAPTTTTAKKPAKLVIHYSKINITSHIHRYSIKVEATLLAPPDQGRLRLRIYWPSEINIVKLKNIQKGSLKMIDGSKHQEYSVDWEQRVFPGETIEIIGPESSHELEYEIDNNSYVFLSGHPRFLTYKLFFEDHGPLEGKISFTELNIF